MHYKNGRVAKVGDKVVGRDIAGQPISGLLVTLYPGSTTCNAALIIAQAPTYSVTLGDVLHVDDAFPQPLPSPL